MTTTFKNLLAIGLATSLVFGCDEEKETGKMPVQEITVVEVIQKDVPIYNEMVGQVYGLKDIPIRARVDGFLEKISFEEGSRVHKGQLLYNIDPEPFIAEVAAQESKVAESKTVMVNAKNELDRYAPLAEINAVSKSDLDAAQASYDASKSSVKAAEANLQQARIRLGYCSIKAPIYGLIGKTEAREGEYVGKEPNPVILNTVSRIDTVRVQFSISEAKYLEVARAYNKEKSQDEITKDIEEGNIKQKIELILADGSIYEENGKIDFVNNSIDSYTGSLLVQASFPNPTMILRPGLYAKVRLTLHTAENAVVIPQRCVTEIQGMYTVLVVDEKNKVSNRSVTLGTDIGDLVIVSDGLKSGEKIVIDALQKARPGTEIVPKVIEFESKTSL